jgi:hypothetical protein
MASVRWRGRPVLQQVAVHADFQRLANGALFAADGQNDATRRYLGFANLAHHLHAGQLGHVQVEQGEIRLERTDRLQRRHAVCALRQHLQVPILANQHQTFANDGLILRDRHRRLLRVIHESPEKK